MVRRRGSYLMVVTGVVCLMSGCGGEATPGASVPTASSMSVPASNSLTSSDRTTSPGRPTGAAPSSSSAPGTAPVTADGRVSSPGKVPDRAQGLVLGFDGLGPAKIGMTMDAFASALGTKLTQGREAGVQDPCWFLRVGGSRSPIAVMSLTGRKGQVVRVDVEPFPGEPTRTSTRTAAGITLGSTTREVLAAYPGRVKQTPHAYVPGGTYLTVRGPGGKDLVFETNSKGVVDSMRAGLSEPAGYIEGCS